MLSSPFVGLRRRFEKTLLVCADNCQAVERRLIAAGCTVTKVSGGDSALYQVHRDMFDAAVLVSTGQDMDLVETVLNLVDIRRAMIIVIVSSQARASKNLIGKITATVPNTIAVSLDELEGLLELSGAQL